jgi:hypothetical protein
MGTLQGQGQVVAPAVERVTVLPDSDDVGHRQIIKARYIGFGQLQEPSGGPAFGGADRDQSSHQRGRGEEVVPAAEMGSISPRLRDSMDGVGQHVIATQRTNDLDEGRYQRIAISCGRTNEVEVGRSIARAYQAPQLLQVWIKTIYEVGLERLPHALHPEGVRVSCKALLDVCRNRCSVLLGD